MSEPKRMTKKEAKHFMKRYKLIWEWDSTFTGAGQLYRVNAAAIDAGSSQNNQGIYIRDGAELTNNIKRGFITYRGKAPIVSESDKTKTTIYYPIPVPKTATKMTATLTPNTQRVALYLYRYNPQNQSLVPYTRINTIGWHTGSQEITFTAEENLFVSFNCSADSAFSPYTVEPDINLLFE